MGDQIRSADLLVKTALADPQIINDLKTNPENTLKQLSGEVVQQLPRLLPDTSTTNWIWLIVVSAFALVMISAVLVLGLGVFKPAIKDADYIAKSDTILTIFTTAVAFLAGLLSPSPVKK